MNNELQIGCFTIIFLIILILASGCLLENIECTYKAKALGYQCHYGIIEGCVLIKPNGKKILLEQLRDFNE